MRTKEMLCWNSIKQRCFNPNNPGYKNYGGRGITLYKEWIKKSNPFIDYIKSLPNYGKEGLSLDRIDVNGNYEPGNLRWADKNMQCQNIRKFKTNKSGYTGVYLDKRTNKYISFIWVNNKKKHLYSGFKTAEEAVQSRNQFIIDNNLSHPIQEVSSPIQDPQQ